MDHTYDDIIDEFKRRVDLASTTPLVVDTAEEHVLREMLRDGDWIMSNRAGDTIDADELGRALTELENSEQANEDLKARIRQLEKGLDKIITVAEKIA